LGKIATWLLYASLAFVMVTHKGTDWPLWIFWIGLVIGLVALASAAGSAERPAALALLPRVVGEARLGPANALLHTVQDLGVVVGPAIGAVLLAVSSAPAAFIANAATFAVSTLLFSMLRPRKAPVGASRGGTAGVLAGLRTARVTPFVLPLFLLVSIVEFTYGAQTVQLVVYADRALGLGTGGYGLLLAASGAGGLISAFFNGQLATAGRLTLIVIGAAALAAGALVVPSDLELLVGIYAFGALVAFTIAHVSVLVLRFREPDRPRAFAVPLSVPFRGAKVPLPTVIGAILAGAGLIAVMVYHAGARYVGGGWLLAGLTLYVIYRKTQGKPLLKRVTIPERALRHEALEPEFGSILVPILGSPLDDDIVQTAGRLAGDTHDDLVEEGAVIEAIWVFEIPLALPLDAPLPETQTRRAREALARAKLVGEEYEGVEVATAMVRARRAGQAIVSEARRRGVEAIVLAAEEPSRVRGGALLGGVGPLENYVGAVTKYVVISKAPCRVILTAPPAGWEAKFDRDRQSSDGSEPITQRDAASTER
jgi:hypothetical protein